MSFRQLLDHTADVLRPIANVLDSTLGDERDAYETVHAGVPCAFWPLQTPITDYGAGETPTGMTGASFEATVVLADRDVIVVTAGPDSPKRWRVMSHRSPGRRFGTAAHHREAQCEPLDPAIRLVGYDTPLPTVLS